MSDRLEIVDRASVQSTKHCKEFTHADKLQNCNSHYDPDVMTDDIGKLNIIFENDGYFVQNCN